MGRQNAAVKRRASAPVIVLCRRNEHNRSSKMSEKSESISGFGLLGALNPTKVTTEVKKAYKYLERASIDYFWEVHENKKDDENAWWKFASEFGKWLHATKKDVFDEAAKLRIKQHEKTIEWDTRSGNRTHEYDHVSIFFLKNCHDDFAIVPNYEKLVQNKATREDLQALIDSHLIETLAPNKKQTKWASHEWMKLFRLLLHPDYDRGDYLFPEKAFQAGTKFQKQIFAAWANLENSDLPQFTDFQLSS